MSYTTNLYAVDLQSLKNAIGSGDTSLLKRLGGGDDNKRVRGRLIRVELDAKGELLLDREPTNDEQVLESVRGLTGIGDRFRMSPEDSNQRPDLFRAIAQIMNDMGIASGRMPSFETCSKESLWNGDEDEDEDSDENDSRFRRLIFAEFSDPETASDDAYALQELCRELGTELDTDDALGGIDDLQIDSPLCNGRMPVDMPKPFDFPFVSYLTPEEVAAEVQRLQSMDLSYPDDSDLEYAREVLLKCLEEAQQENQAVVAFYY